ncbi:hypothetical protein AMK68_03925 [candidate division KD3-62 bacterium DG_56]|uniref:Radical SAM core domain-containing protein n=1 Tax=candidate division KD3-62 bacterium DG_56 TaxID=1704032 RepID=A0A0S7XLY4_9BACT|nr:MAG: hypothetical protein AMK68_03925 [candidate division KD3-62 bacterium DG_56]
MADFQLLIKPVSADCNLVCDYCFYRRTLAQYPEPRHRMSPETLERMISLALAAGYPDTTVFAWQGGEPTLAGIDFYRQALRLMNRHGRDRQPVGNALQTNGVLLDHEWARLCADYSILVGVSLDGPREIHDRWRTTAAGGGSFDTVMRGIGHLRAAGAEFNILTMVTATSAPHGELIYRFLREHGFAHLQFIPCVEVNPQTGGPTEHTPPPEAYGEFMCAVFDAWRREAASGVSVRLFDAMMRHALTGESGLCELGAGCGSYYVVEYNGDVYPCDFFVAPEWHLGNLHEQSFDEIRQTARWQQFVAQRDGNAAACGDCRWFDLCRGGCSKDRLPAGGAQMRSYLCRSHQRFFEHAAEALREIAQQRCPSVSS